MCVIDPEGDYRSLEALPGVSVLGGDDPAPTPRELLRALRYPDRSLVIELSHVPQDEKIAYIRSVLPALNTMRRRTGLPHRILLDEAHYFLHDADGSTLLDFESNGYIVVTYCASRLPADLLAATEVMIVTCESNPAEIDALHRCCSRHSRVDRAAWSALAHLGEAQAVALPSTAEAGGGLKLFTMARRLTPHVQQKVLNALRQPVHRLNAAQMRIDAKTLSNHKSNLRAALLHFAKVANAPTRGARLSSDWFRLMPAIPGTKPRRLLSGIMRYCSARSIHPEDMTSGIVEAYFEFRTATSFLETGIARQRELIRAWNDCVDHVPGWPNRQLSVPQLPAVSKGPDWARFPPGLRQDVDNYLFQLAKAHRSPAGKRRPG
jgi:hypothetical protein